MPTSMSCCADAMPLCTIISDLNASRKIRGSLNAAVRCLAYYRGVEDAPLNHLRAWRKHNRMTQQELADAVGTAKSVISDLERSVVQLSDKWLRRLAPALKTQPGYILDHDPSDLDTDIINIWAHIDVVDREQAARVLRSFMKTGTDD